MYIIDIGGARSGAPKKEKMDFELGLGQKAEC